MSDFKILRLRSLSQKVERCKLCLPFRQLDRHLNLLPEESSSGVSVILLANGEDSDLGELALEIEAAFE